MKGLKLILGMSWYYDYIFLKDSLAFRVPVKLFTWEMIL